MTSFSGRMEGMEAKREQEPDWHELARQKAEAAIRDLNPDVSVSIEEVDVKPYDPLREPYWSRLLLFRDQKTGGFWLQEIETNADYVENELPRVVQDGYADRLERKKADKERAVRYLIDDLPDARQAKARAEAIAADLNGEERRAYRQRLLERKRDAEDDRAFRSILSGRAGWSEDLVETFDQEDLAAIRARYAEAIDVGLETLDAL